MNAAGLNVVPTRMSRQGLCGSSAPDALAVLDSLVAMQGQEFGYSLWALAQRVRPDARPTRAEMLAAFDRGDILRTHVLRPTWHLVRPADVRSLLRLTGPRIRRAMAGYDRRAGLDRAELDRSQAVLAAEVAGGRHRTRKELGQALGVAGIEASGQRLAHLVSHAEFDEVLISGAMAGKQQTYAAFDERVPPQNRQFDPDAALAALAGRYVATRAPVTAKDFAGWATLTIGQARAGLAAAGCVPATVGARVFYHPSDGRPETWSAATGRRRSPRVDLLQGYDELIMSYSESRGAIIPEGRSLPVLNYDNYLHVVLIDGTVAGHWRHQFTGAGSRAVVQLQPIRPWTAAERAAVAAAVADYGGYLECPTELE